jgi:release factor glutamine methyltransferase
MTSMSARGATGDRLTVRDLLLDTAARLGSATEARWLVEQALGGRTGVMAQARSGIEATPEQIEAVEAMIERRLGGEPLQYVLGMWAFRTLELAVDPRVLIPRPETEVVVGHALDEIRRAIEEAPPADDRVVAVDLGTGSGAIALSLAVEAPKIIGDRVLELWATDVDIDSLELASHNAGRVAQSHQGSAHVNFVHGSWFDALPEELAGRITLVVANPPYVSESEWDDLDPVVRDHEPRDALVAGPLGTEMIDKLLAEGPRWLAPGGALVLEIAPHQAEDAALRAIVSGFDAVVVRQDFAERSRALVARYYGSALFES